MVVELKGTLKIIYAEQHINDNVSKKEFVVTIEGDTQYPQDIKVDALNNKVDALDSFKMGDSVFVRANLRGREHNGKYYNQLLLWDIQKA